MCNIAWIYCTKWNPTANYVTFGLYVYNPAKSMLSFKFNFRLQFPTFFIMPLYRLRGFSLVFRYFYVNTDKCYQLIQLHKKAASKLFLYMFWMEYGMELHVIENEKLMKNPNMIFYGNYLLHGECTLEQKKCISLVAEMCSLLDMIAILRIEHSVSSPFSKQTHLFPTNWQNFVVVDSSQLRLGALFCQRISFGQGNFTSRLELV